MGGLFKTIGPIELERGENGIDEDNVRTIFLDETELFSGLAKAVGVYILAHRKLRGPLTPWYVGKTEKGFEKRLRQHSKLKKGFGDISKIPVGGKLEVFFIALVSEKGKFRKPLATSQTVLAIKSLEERLIGTCLHLNENLLNTSNKRLNKDLRVPGYLGDEGLKRDLAASELALMLKTS